MTLKLSAQGLHKRYGKRPIVQDVSVHVSTGEVVGLLGPNGAGKTTSFYMIVGLVPADAGVIKIGDKDVSRKPMHARARMGIGYLPQEASVFRKLSVRDNIMAILETRDDLNRKARKAELSKLLTELSIEKIKDSLGISLSGGERRRVEIARALAANPRFILLDEPFAGVDPISVGDIQQIIRHLQQRDIGVLITDHNVRETLGICQRAYILAEGKVIAEGDQETILGNAKVRASYLGENFKL